MYVVKRRRAVNNSVELVTAAELWALSMPTLAAVRVLLLR